MTTVANKQNDSVKTTRDNRPDANQTALACLTTYAPSAVLFEGYVYRQLKVLDKSIHELEKRLDRLDANIEQQYHRHGEYMSILAACQRDTASVLNREIDRHALHPAIETVVALSEELSHLKDYVSQMPNGSPDHENIEKIGGEIDLSCTVAQERLANLDVQIITADRGQELDARVHSACGSIVTVDRDLQGKISKLVTPGIAYRGKVLRQARVTVFRMKTSKKQQ